MYMRHRTIDGADSSYDRLESGRQRHAGSLRDVVTYYACADMVGGLSSCVIDTDWVTPTSVDSGLCIVALHGQLQQIKAAHRGYTLLCGCSKDTRKTLDAALDRSQALVPDEMRPAVTLQRFDSVVSLYWICIEIGGISRAHILHCWHNDRPRFLSYIDSAGKAWRKACREIKALRAAQDIDL